MKTFLPRLPICRKRPAWRSASTGWSCWRPARRGSTRCSGHRLMIRRNKRLLHAPVSSGEQEMRSAMPAARKTLRSVSELVDTQLIKSDRLTALQNVAARYAVAITSALADLIDAADPRDPIARQFVPDARELESRDEENADPIGDEAHSPVPGVVHRYPDRVLLKIVNACAVYCRFCFRREMVGPGRGALTGKALAAALDYI